jgi:hypothetical protein
VQGLAAVRQPPACLEQVRSQVTSLTGGGDLQTGERQGRAVYVGMSHHLVHSSNASCQFAESGMCSP